MCNTQKLQKEKLQKDFIKILNRDLFSFHIIKIYLYLLYLHCFSYALSHAMFEYYYSTVLFGFDNILITSKRSRVKVIDIHIILMSVAYYRCTYARINTILLLPRYLPKCLIFNYSINLLFDKILYIVLKKLYTYL